jgi:N utilization substance protein B
MSGIAASTKRSAARLGAVQALYQIEAADEIPRIVIEEFVNHRLGAEIEGVEYADADPEFFADIVRGVHSQMAQIDDAINAALSGTWTVARQDRTVRQVLRAGTYEILARIDVPTAVIITEYVDVTHAFYDGSEPGFVNGVLDKIGKNRRPDTPK